MLLQALLIQPSPKLSHFNKMSNLNYVYLLWQVDKKKSLEYNVGEGLKVWTKKKDTTDIVPELLVLPDKDRAVITAKTISGLEVTFSKLVQPGYFKIGGSIF